MKASKSTVFLFELMIIIMVFTIAAAICTSIFAESYMMSRESSDLTMSSINAQTIAEEFKSGVDEIETLYFDHHWTETHPNSAIYVVQLEKDTSVDSMRSAVVVVYREGKSIYSLPIKEYIG